MRVRGKVSHQNGLQTTLELQQFLMAWTATANQGIKISLANNSSFRRSRRVQFQRIFFQHLKTVLPSCSNRLF